MSDFFKNLDRKKIIVGIIYIIGAILVCIFLPQIMSFGNPEVKQTLKGAMKFFQIILFVFLLIMPVIVLQKGGGISNKNTKKYGDQGTAIRGTIGELRDLCGNDGLSLSRNVRLSASKSYEHVAIIGPTGSGKSSAFFIPNLLDLDGKHSAVVTDPKGELHELTYRYLKSLNYNIIKLEPLNPKANEFYYNPLLIVEDITQIREVAQLILTNGNKAVEIATGSSSGGAEWINMSIPLLVAAFAYVKEFGNKKTINEAIDIILQDSLEEMERKFKKCPGAYRNFLIFKSSAGSEKTLSSIKSVLTTNVQLFLDDKIEEFTKSPIAVDDDGAKYIDMEKVFNPLILRQKPTVLFVCVPEIKSTYMMPLMSVFYSQVLDVCMNNKEGCPIFFLLDEFANIGVIPSIANITATARSRRIGIALGLQGVEQLRRNYGEENAADILNNLKAKVIFSGLTGDSAQYVSDLAGVTTVESISYSNNPNQGANGQAFLGDIISSVTGGGTSVSKSGVRRELLTPDEVRRMDPDDVLIIAHNKNPVFDKKNTYFTQRKYTLILEKFKPLNK